MDDDCCDAEFDCPCPPAGLVDVVGKKWAICVVTLLGRYGTLRFGPIQRSLPRVSPATLTATLRALEKERLVRRSADGAARGSAVRYDLTERGRELYQRLLPLAGWLRNAEPARPPYRTA